MKLFESPWRSEDIEELSAVLERRTYWSDGPEVDAFENEIARISRRSHGLAFSSGTTGLYALMEALDVRDREVVVPSFTFPATVNAVAAAGGIPVFADIERETFGLDESHVADLIGPSTAAVVVVHFAGFVAAEIRNLRSVTERAGIPLIEDNAHSIGAMFDGEVTGSFGLAAMTSHCFNKIVTTGEGGCVVTDNTDLHSRLERLRNHGRVPDGGRDYDAIGLNLRLSSLAAALGIVQVRRMESLVAERTRQATVYDKAFTAIEGVQTPSSQPAQEPVWLLYNLILESEADRDGLALHLQEQGIPTRVTYRPVHLYSVYRDRFHGREGQLPTTEDIARRILTIPLYPGLKQEDQARVVEGVHDYWGLRVG